MRKVKFSSIGIFLVLVVLASGFGAALDYNQVIANSENWEDVYSSMLYASLNGIDGNFLTSTSHGTVLLNSISTSKDVLVVSSEDEPFVFNYDTQIMNRGFNSAEEMVVEDANLELAQEMDDITNFIVVGTDYGYSAIAVTPYAVQTYAWVLLVDRVNIAEVETFLRRRNVDNLLIYGYVDAEVTDALEEYDPEIINSGNRFEDNIEIVKKFKENDDIKQVLLSNGEFIENEIMNGDHPVLFTGSENVPDQIADYLKSSNIEVGVLVGNELINAATNIRRDTGLSVMVKFAQGARSQTSGVSAVEGLDLFYLPTPTLSLSIYSIKYNKATSSIEVTYKSDSNVPIYVQGTITAISGDEETRAGDEDPVFIAPDDYKTLSYSDINLEGETLTAEILTYFGEVADSLDRALEGTFDMGVINVIDNCEVEINSVRYNKQSKSFFVVVKELSGNDCYVDVEIQDIEINRIEQTIGTEGSVLVKAGKTARIEIDERMTDDDLYENDFVNAVAYYGEREDSLVKVFRGKFELKIDLITRTTMMIIVVLIILILILLFLWKRKKDDDW